MEIWAALILIAIAGALFYIQRVPRIICWLAFIAGTGFAAVFSGWILGIPTGTAAVWTTRICGLAGIVGLIIFAHDALPKLGRPRRWQTPVLGLLVPTLVAIGIGGVVGTVFNDGLREGVGGGITTAVHTVFGTKGQ
jgi:hypothetical protein